MFMDNRVDLEFNIKYEVAQVQSFNRISGIFRF